jgi:linoleoyl-CoA desaturase
MLGVPLLCLNYHWTTIVIFYLGFNFVLSFFLLLFFATSHISDHSHYVTQALDGGIPHSFSEHQLLTSVDYHPESRFLGFWLGGFNAHVAHHLFPHICSVHYVALTSVIKECAQQHHKPYQELTLWQALKAHLRMIKLLGQDPDQGKAYVISP